MGSFYPVGHPLGPRKGRAVAGLKGQPQRVVQRRAAPKTPRRKLAASASKKKYRNPCIRPHSSVPKPSVRTHCSGREFSPGKIDFEKYMLGDFQTASRAPSAAQEES